MCRRLLGGFFVSVSPRSTGEDVLRLRLKALRSVGGLTSVISVRQLNSGQDGLAPVDVPSEA